MPSKLALRILGALAVVLILSGCDALDNLRAKILGTGGEIVDKARGSAEKTVNQLKETRDAVREKIDQVKTAANEVEEAATEVKEAVDAIEKIGGEDEKEKAVTPPAVPEKKAPSLEGTK